MSCRRELSWNPTLPHLRL
ncbi:hypothetical protein A483_HHAL011801 [Halyomorpha halys]|nr:hypothetical protein A483_HHAL011801 [Halyomorpha halys]